MRLPRSEKEGECARSILVTSSVVLGTFQLHHGITDFANPGSSLETSCLEADPTFPWVPDSSGMYTYIYIYVYIYICICYPPPLSTIFVP